MGWLALVPLTSFFAAFALLLRGGPPLSVSVPWVPSLGVDLGVHLDGLALLMVLLITGVGACVFVYAAGYMQGESGRRRLALVLLLFMTAMLGCVTADNLLVVFACWEITSITSFLLVGFHHEEESSRKSALQALLVTTGGGLALLAGVVLLGNMAGTYSIQELLRTAPAWREQPLRDVALLCVIVGAFSKSAQLPFHFWLPNAMAAPTPVSAYLHSATMVKLGVYLLARMDAAFDGTPFWGFTLMSCGGLTSAWAVLQTLRERDLKRILAWSTVSALGTMVMLIGLPGDDSALAVAAFVLAHALYKAPLFFVAGNVDHSTGTRNIDHLAGLAPRMPWTAAAALLAAASMSGFPMSFGYLAKELTNVAKKEGGLYTWIGHSSVLASAITVAVSAIAAIRIFWHRGGAVVPGHVHEVGWSMRLPPLLIASVGILFGVRPRLADPLIGAAAEAMHPLYDFAAASATARAEPGWTALLVALTLGVGVFLAWDRLHDALGKVELPSVLRLADWYERLLRGIPAAARGVTGLLQRGALTGYVTSLVGFVVVVLGAVTWALLGQRGVAVEVSPGGAPWGKDLGVLGAAVVLSVGAVAACLVRDSFVLLLSSGLVGMACALLFLFLGAPDLAFTQFGVEVAFVVVVASTLLRLRRMDARPSAPQRRLPRIVLSTSLGVLVTALLLVALGAPTFDPEVAAFFAEHSVEDAHGRNVVNVLLVDFRAFDTLGEIVVVLVSFLATLPLFQALRVRGGEPS